MKYKHLDHLIAIGGFDKEYVITMGSVRHIVTRKSLEFKMAILVLTVFNDYQICNPLFRGSCEVSIYRA